MPRSKSEAESETHFALEAAIAAAIFALPAAMSPAWCSHVVSSAAVFLEDVKESCWGGDAAVLELPRWEEAAAFRP